MKRIPSDRGEAAKVGTGRGASIGMPSPNAELSATFGYMGDNDVPDLPKEFLRKLYYLATAAFTHGGLAVFYCQPRVSKACPAQSGRSSSALDSGKIVES